MVGYRTHVALPVTHRYLHRGPLKFSATANTNTSSFDDYRVEEDELLDEVVMVTDQIESSRPVRSLTAINLVFLAFFIVCGGPFGIEGTHLCTLAYTCVVWFA
jgi:hypothetical protein